MEERSCETESNPKTHPKTKDAKRTILTEQLLNEWVYIPMPDGTFVYAKHILVKNGSHNRIVQILLSGDESADGAWFIQDYDIDKIWDKNKWCLQLKMNKFNKNIGINIPKSLKNFDDLKQHLIDVGYLNANEFDLYSDKSTKPDGLNKLFFDL